MNQVIIDLIALLAVGAGSKLQEQNFEETAASLGVIKEEILSTSRQY